MRALMFTTFVFFSGCFHPTRRISDEAWYKAHDLQIQHEKHMEYTRKFYKDKELTESNGK